MATFRKRGNRWQAQVRRLGTFESATFDTKAAAAKWARRIESEVDQGTALGRERVTGTVGELLASYEIEARKVRPIGRSKLGVLKQLREGLGAVPLRTLNADSILRHCRDRRAKGAGGPSRSPRIFCKVLTSLPSTSATSSSVRSPRSRRSCVASIYLAPNCTARGVLRPWPR